MEIVRGVITVVRISKLQLFETMVWFNSNNIDLANEPFDLGEPISKENLVRKSLLLEKAKNISKFI